MSSPAAECLRFVPCLAPLQFGLRSGRSSRKRLPAYGQDSHVAFKYPTVLYGALVRSFNVATAVFAIRKAVTLQDRCHIQIPRSSTSSL